MDELLAQDPLAWLQALPTPVSPARRQLLHALASRASAAPPGALRDGLLRALQRQASRPDSQASLAASAPTVRASSRGELAALVARLRAAGGGAEPRVLQQHARVFGEMRLARRLAEVEAPVPEHLGPLNNQVLVRRALQQLQTLSADYLQRFIAHVDGLAALAPLTTPEPAEAPRSVTRGAARSPRAAKPVVGRKTAVRR